MRRIAVAAGVVALAMAAVASEPARAQSYGPDWPWCADLAGDDGGGGTNCGFASWHQCQAYISGIGGWCYPNPYQRREPASRRQRR